ncbi:MAG: hypothetical protein JSR17_06425 [Proteobacteria bacterium]|nr:hypothetical protein [Pseudomonadota bacterium]
MLSLGKKIGIFQQDAAPVVTPVAPICADADTLCQLNEFLKEQGYDVPAAIEGRTGLQVPTHLPQTVQDGLGWVNDQTNGYVTPARASVAAVVAGSVLGTLFSIWATRRLLNAIFKDCPTNVLEVIKDDADAMAFFEKLTKDAKHAQLIVALSQMNAESVKNFFAQLQSEVNVGTKSAPQMAKVDATILQMDAASQVGVVRSVMARNGQNFNDKKQASRLAKHMAAKEAATKEAAAKVTVPGTQEAAATVAAPAATGGFRSYLPSVKLGSYYIPRLSWAATPAAATAPVAATEKPKMN